MPTIPPVIVRWLIIAAILAAAAAAGAAKMYQHDRIAYDKLAAQLSEERGAVKQASVEYRARVAAKEAKDRQDKEKANAQHKVDLAAARDDAARMRVERDLERGKRFLAERPAGSQCADGQLCFDAAAFRAAYGRLLQCVRSGADRCTAVEQALQNAMDWVK